MMMMMMTTDNNDYNNVPEPGQVCIANRLLLAAVREQKELEQSRNRRTS